MLRYILITMLTIGSACVLAQAPANGVGEIKGPLVLKSSIFPGTERNYWVYVPKKYDPTKPACLMVVQDGLSRATGWKLPSTLDSLINAGAIPPIIGVFVDHGKVSASGSDNYPRFNRSLEYDGLGDRYARFLLEELLPEVSKTFNISSDPNDRSIAGASSGAICAFNVAWERPDSFRRVLSTIGTYVGLRGGDEIATLVRKTEPKPLRVFLEDGNRDLNIYAGDWYMANQDMLSALKWAGYEVSHSWGDGGHDSKHASMILADALVWLWKDYPTPVTVHRNEMPRVFPVISSEGWTEVALPQDMSANKLAANKNGDLFFTANTGIYKLTKEGAVLIQKTKGGAGGIAFHENGTLYFSDPSKDRIFATEENASTTQTIVNGVDAGFLTATAKGIYFSDLSKERIGFYSFSKKSVTYASTPSPALGLAVNAEQTFLNVSLSNQVFGHSFRIADDGTLDSGQEYIHFHIPYGKTTAEPVGMAVDRDNLLYTASAMGIQVSDQLGRVNFIFSKPHPDARDVRFAGPQFDVIYASCAGKLFSRKVTAKGVLPWSAPVKPPRPGL